MARGRCCAAWFSRCWPGSEAPDHHGGGCFSCGPFLAALASLALPVRRTGEAEPCPKARGSGQAAGLEAGVGGAAKSARAARLKAQLPELEVRLSEARKRKDSDSADSDRMSQRSSAVAQQSGVAAARRSSRPSSCRKSARPSCQGAWAAHLWLCGSA